MHRAWTLPSVISEASTECSQGTSLHHRPLCAPLLPSEIAACAVANSGFRLKVDQSAQLPVFCISHTHHDSDAEAITASITTASTGSIDCAPVDRSRKCAGALPSESRKRTLLSRLTKQGVESTQAGKADACEGCPNQSVCAEGPKGPDPDLPLIRERMKAVKRKVLVLSGKGGVGKSTFTAGLSWALAADEEVQVSLLIARRGCM